MPSLAREYNQDNLIVIKKLEYKFIEETMNKGSFGNDIKNANYKVDKASSTVKDNEGKILLVEHYEPKEGGGLKVVNKADKDIYEKYKIIAEENKVRQEKNKIRSRLRR